MIAATNRPRIPTCLLLLFSLAGFQADLPAGPDKLTIAAPASGARPELTGTLVPPLNVDLRWKNGPLGTQGHLVEYTSDLRDEYVILGIMPADTTTFQHPDLAPHTKFFYRVRPYIGEASSVARITTGKTPPSPETIPLGDGEPIIEKADAKTAAQKKSLRQPLTATDATPSELTATLPGPLRVALRWKDRANDEDGYLLEAAAPGQNRFEVLAFMPPDTVGFTVPYLPAETECRFRVRAFFYGPSSNIVEKITGAEPPPPALTPTPKR
jgi:hypothetical protein